jgi:hypothetical protein
MAHAREIRLLQGLVDTQLKSFGWKDPKALFVGQDGEGYASLFVNFTDATYSTNDVAVLVRLIPAGDGLPASMFTLSHSGNAPIHGSVHALVAVEAPAAPMGDHAKFIQDVVHCLRGQLGSPVELKLTANGVLPAFKGINGAGADSLPADSMALAPSRTAVVGGV